MVPEDMRPPLIPLSTYRLQFNRNFTFSQATELIPYLAELGISHCYASPYLRARPGSMHGYDIVDHHELNPEIGTLEEYERFVRNLHEHGMGQILDIVPNHMGIMGSDNAWWLDVLENGEASAYADFFDIDWYPLKDELQGKVLVPVLGDQYGTILDRAELRLAFDKEKGEFSIHYFKHRFPVNPKEYPRILSFGVEALQQRLGPQNADLLELQSSISAFNHLPGREESAPEKRSERLRDKEIHKRRLAALCARSSDIAEFVAQIVEKINGTSGDPASFDSLHELIKTQAYRLAFWRVAADDINYRRFFDVNDLAALRQENENVFNQTHEFVSQLLREGKINGLRIDHPDGLYNPQQYFQRLQQGSNSSLDENGEKRRYIVAEKILTSEETIAEDWPIHGTTGYNFCNLVNGLFVDPASEKKMDRIYRLFIGEHTDFKELVYECKKLVMERSLNSELNVMANHLSRIALADRHTCDFTLKSLRDALTEIVACFPVYRTYVTEQQVSASGRAYIEEAVNCAKEKGTIAESSVYDFIREILLTSRLEGRPQFYQRSVIHFAMRFQQYTSALMAKGLEDTSFYRYNRLVSLNEVGGDPLRFGVTPEEFHRKMEYGAKTWPHEMVATSTHDSKRSEDVRARIDVLSEMPLAWHRHVRNWRKLNGEEETPGTGKEAPSANDEYLLYQTLIGAWPFLGSDDAPEKSFVDRICNFMLKAIREAKDKTNWANPNQDYESSVVAFVKSAIESREFREDFVPFQRKVAHFGMLNSLSQVLIKLTAPGVPDIYQGNELWDFSLVDPDNRRAVDYKARLRALQLLKKTFASTQQPTHRQLRRLAQHMEDGRIKLYMVWRALHLRSQSPELFQGGEYVPLRVTGEKAKHVLAFARSHGDVVSITAVPRLCAELLGGKQQLPGGEETWRDTAIQLPQMSEERLVNVFTGELVPSQTQGAVRFIQASAMFSSFPVALLISGQS
jgi:(1->4)-alpha-D-glucan 1-alpha-D-glucosylmutase